MIPARNAAGVLPAQLEALASQDFGRSWEVVVVDDHSSDDTARVVQRTAERFPVALRVVDPGPRTGVSHARNVGASAARGELLAFCDADDRVGPGWLQAAADGLAHADLVGGVLRELTEPFRFESPVMAHSAFIAASFGGAVLGCNFAVRRHVYFAAGGFDEALPPYGCNDTGFSIWVNEAGFDAVEVPEMVVYFRQTSGAWNVARKVWSSAQAEVVVWDHHPNRYAMQARRRVIAARVMKLPVDVLRHLIKGQGLRAISRTVLTRVGNLVGSVRFARPGGAARPELVFEPMEVSDVRRKAPRASVS